MYFDILAAKFVPGCYTLAVSEALSEDMKVTLCFFLYVLVIQFPINLVSGHTGQSFVL